ncbi:MAG: hypothetical protein WC979_02355 [Candidatus Pacearchaeota archaeon]|jgi:hypothetical protein|nr:hypothetical protein [Clostridia bacterium]
MESKNEFLVNDLQPLSWAVIAEKFDVIESEINHNLTKANYAPNYWYPYDEYGFNEIDIKCIISIFEFKFPDMIIRSKHDTKYTEFFLNTLEKHQMTYTIIDLILNKE